MEQPSDRAHCETVARQPTRPEPRLQRVTRTTAATFWPALSSDARMVVYVSDAGQEAPRRKCGCSRWAVRRAAHEEDARVRRAHVFRGRHARDLQRRGRLDAARI